MRINVSAGQKALYNAFIFGVMEFLVIDFEKVFRNIHRCEQARRCIFVPFGLLGFADA